MTVLRYCVKVQVALLDYAVEDCDRARWWGDTGRASLAVTRALEGRDEDALALAEPIAEAWHLLV